MNIRCPNCQTVFRVDPARVPASGIRARCSRCAQTFFVQRDQTAAAAESASAAVPAAASRTAPPTAPSAPPRSAPTAAAARPAHDTPAAAAPAVERAAAVQPQASTRAPTRPAANAETVGAAAEAAAPQSAPGAAAVAERSWTPPSAAPAPRQGWSPPNAAPAGPTAAPAASAPAAAATGTAEAPRPHKFGSRDPDARAMRIARALVSDIIAYHPKRWESSREAGTLRAEFREEIMKSWEEYVAQVGLDLAKSTPHFRTALNDILARGQQIF